MPKNNSKAQREYRTKSAQERQAKYDALTPSQKVARLFEHVIAGGGLAVKQSAKLAKKYRAEYDATATAL